MNTQHIEKRIRACQHQLSTVEAEIKQVTDPHHHAHLLNLRAEIGNIEYTATKGQTSRQRARARSQLKTKKQAYSRLLNLKEDRLTAKQQKLTEELAQLESQRVKH